MTENPQIEEGQYQFYEVASTQDLPAGEMMFVDIGSQSLVIFNVNNEYYAIADVCSHDGGALGEGELEGCEIICPRHGARFDIRTGKALRLPAVTDIRSYPVKIVDGNIEVGIA
jgi:3-phenylpropionate/trans-cinnamate dioxygenase ferredoxin component